MALPGELLERDGATDECEIVRARVGDAEVVSSIVKPGTEPMVLLRGLSVDPPADELELDDDEPVLLPPVPALSVMRRFEAIFRSPCAGCLDGDGGSPATIPPSGLRRCGVDFILAGDRGGLRGAESMVGAFRVTTCPPICLLAACCCC